MAIYSCRDPFKDALAEVLGQKDINAFPRYYDARSHVQTLLIDS